MTNQIFVTTDITGTKAWTLNPFGEKEPNCSGQPHCCSQNPYKENKRCNALLWQQAESQRKCYEIKWELGNTLKLRDSGALVLGKINGFSLKPNTTYIAEIVDENTVRILKEVK